MREKCVGWFFRGKHFQAISARNYFTEFAAVNRHQFCTTTAQKEANIDISGWVFVWAPSTWSSKIQLMQVTLSVALYTPPPPLPNSERWFCGCREYYQMERWVFRFMNWQTVGVHGRCFYFYKEWGHSLSSSIFGQWSSCVIDLVNWANKAGDKEEGDKDSGADPDDAEVWETGVLAHRLSGVVVAVVIRAETPMI